MLAAAAKLKVLIGHQHQLGTGYLGHFLAQALDDLLRRHLALAERLQAYQHEGVVDAVAAANKPGDAFHGRVFQHRAAEDLHLRLHHTEGQPVVAPDKTDQLTGVLLGQESFRDHHIQRDVDANGNE
ncbi:hypothetical protein D3C78_1245680 [compost metagenome]